MLGLSSLNDEERVLYEKASTFTDKIEHYSNKVDEKGSFPEESLMLLRENGYMGLSIPKQYGGAGASVRLITSLCSLFSGHCLTTGMVWAMHMQQVELISRFANEQTKKRLLPKIAKDGAYVVSVTSDRSRMRGPFTTSYYLVEQENSYLIERDAPTVTGGAHGDIYIVTMRVSPESERMTFVIVEREQIKIEAKSTWNAMGMRGTQSCELNIKGEIGKDQILDPSGFEQYCITAMNPLGHLYWTACWYGAVKRMYMKLIKLVRRSGSRWKFNLESDLLLSEIGKLRSRLDIVESYINHFIDYYESNVSINGLRPDENEMKYKIKVNNLKVVCSEILSEATDQMVQLAGVRYGYIKSEEFPLERLYRDIRSSKLMLPNSLLYTLNGKMSLVEKL